MGTKWQRETGRTREREENLYLLAHELRPITFSLAGVHNEKEKLKCSETTANQVWILHKGVLYNDAIEPPESRHKERGHDEWEGQHLCALGTKHFG